MQGYYFKLQPLLNKERIYEDECAGRLRAIYGEYREESNKLKKLLDDEIKSQEELKAKQQQGVSLAVLRIYEDYFIKIVDDIDISKNNLIEIAKKYRDAQNELSKIMKKRKALEKLKEKGIEEYKNELFSALSKEMDEIAMAKFNRNKRDGSA